MTLPCVGLYDIEAWQSFKHSIRI